MLEEIKKCDIIFSDDPIDEIENLLKYYDIKKPIITLKSTNTNYADNDQIKLMIDYINNGKRVLLVATEGQVGMADPGPQFIETCINNNLPYTVIPGPSSFINAYVSSGFSGGDVLMSYGIHNVVEVLSLHANKQYGLIVPVYYDDLNNALAFIDSEIYYENKQKMVAICVDMTLPNELVIVDKTNKIINNPNINKINKDSKIIIVLSTFKDIDLTK
jgi:16S rRNA C1402 (ribose-2'-O) methylase RsmI